MIAIVNDKTYQFRLTNFKGKDWITIEHLIVGESGIEQIIRRDSVPLPHPAYQDGEWQPTHYEKLVKSGQVIRKQSRGAKGA